MIISDSTYNGTKTLVFLQELMNILNDDLTYNGSWLIMDNARQHHIEGVRTLTRNSNHSIQFISPYSYMLNPVELIFSKVKL